MAYVSKDYRLPMPEIIDGELFIRERPALPLTMAEIDERMNSALRQFHQRKPGDSYIDEKDMLHILGDSLKEKQEQP